jgi:hypothetical protein
MPANVDSIEGEVRFRSNAEPSASARPHSSFFETEQKPVVEACVLVEDQGVSEVDV